MPLYTFPSTDLSLFILSPCKMKKRQYLHSLNYSGQSLDLKLSFSRTEFLLSSLSKF